MLQCVAVCCRVSVLQCVAACCSALQYDAVCCSMLQCVAVCCRVSVLQCVAACCSALQYDPACCNMLQCVAVCCRISVLQCVAVCCSALQCAAVSEPQSTSPGFYRTGSTPAEFLVRADFSCGLSHKTTRRLLWLNIGFVTS